MFKLKWGKKTILEFEKDKRGNKNDENKLGIRMFHCLQHRKLEKAEAHVQTVREKEI